MTQSDVVRMMAFASQLKADADAAMEEAKAMASAWRAQSGMDVAVGAEGVVTFAERAGSRTLDRAKLAKVLSPEQMAACERVGKSSVVVAFKAKRDEQERRAA
jgi:hypothetical protein